MTSDGPIESTYIADQNSSRLRPLPCVLDQQNREGVVPVWAEVHSYHSPSQIGIFPFEWAKGRLGS